MTELKYDKAITGLLVIDPYNDFLSEGGKVWDRIKGVAEAASYSDEQMHAGLDVNIPNYASSILTADELVHAISG